MTGIDRAAVREQVRAGINTAISNSGHPESHTGWSPSAEVDRVTDAVMARVTAALDRDRMAAVIDPAAFDETKPRSKHHAAAVQWAARQHMAFTAADNLLAAAVIRSEAEVKAEALREAAEDWYGDDGAWDKRGSEATWLRDRADTLAPREPDGGVVPGATS